MIFFWYALLLFNWLFLCLLWTWRLLHFISLLWHHCGLLLLLHNLCFFYYCCFEEVSFLLPLLCHLLVVKCILVASPGFVKDQFISYLFKEAVRQDNKTLLENRPKFMLVHSSSGHKYSLKGTSCLALRIKQISPKGQNSMKYWLFCRNPLWSHCDK